MQIVIIVISRFGFSTCDTIGFIAAVLFLPVFGGFDPCVVAVSVALMELILV